MNDKKRSCAVGITRGAGLVLVREQKGHHGTQSL